MRAAFNRFRAMGFTNEAAFILALAFVKAG